MIFKIFAMAIMPEKSYASPKLILYATQSLLVLVTQREIIFNGGSDPKEPKLLLGPNKKKWSNFDKKGQYWLKNKKSLCIKRDIFFSSWPGLGTS